MCKKLSIVYKCPTSDIQSFFKLKKIVTYIFYLFFTFKLRNTFFSYLNNFKTVIYLLSLSVPHLTHEKFTFLLRLLTLHFAYIYVYVILIFTLDLNFMFLFRLLTLHFAYSNFFLKLLFGFLLLLIF